MKRTSCDPLQVVNIGAFTGSCPRDPSKRCPPRRCSSTIFAMVFSVRRSEIGTRFGRTAVNDTCTLMAALAGDSQISIHIRGDAASSWLATCAHPMAERLLSGEEIVHMAWGPPQFGSVLAAGTTMGRVFILSNRPDAERQVQTEMLHWRSCCTLLDSGTLSYKRRVTDMAFAPPVMGLCLAVIHFNGHAHVCPCAKPGLPHDPLSWQNTYTIQPSRPIKVSIASTYAHTSSEDQCVGLTWQPQMHAQQPFLAIATQSCVSVWCFERSRMSWVCVLSDVESRAQVRASLDNITSVAWAPLMGREAECIAVGRGSVVRIFALQGHIRHGNAKQRMHVHQVGQDLAHDSKVWKLAWDCLGMNLAVSCERVQNTQAYVALWKLRLTGDLGDRPSFIVRANGARS
eukprot:jgi/Ulvmu1/8262/UM041_0073.1